MQVWVGPQVEADPHDPAWQDLVHSHRSGPATIADRDELGGSRVLRPRQRVTLTTVLLLPPGMTFQLTCVTTLTNSDWLCAQTMQFYRCTGCSISVE